MHVKTYSTVANVTVNGHSYDVSVPGSPDLAVTCDHQGFNIALQPTPTLSVTYNLPDYQYVLTEKTATRVVTRLLQGVVGPRGPMGPPGLGGDSAIIQADVGPIYAGTTGLVDSLLAATWRSAKWLVTITDDANKLYTTCELLAVNLTSGIEFTQYGIVGDEIPWTPYIELNAGDIEFSVQNGHTTALYVSAIRLPTYNYPT